MNLSANWGQCLSWLHSNPRLSMYGLFTLQNWLVKGPECRCSYASLTNFFKEWNFKIRQLYCEVVVFFCISPGKLTWNMKITCLKRNEIIFQAFMRCTNFNPLKKTTFRPNLLSCVIVHTVASRPELFLVPEQGLLGNKKKGTTARTIAGLES